MEQRRKVSNLIIVILLTIVSNHSASSSQNLYTLATIDIDSDSDQSTDYILSQPSNTTTSIYQDSTTYLPILTSTEAETEEILEPAETKTLNRYEEYNERYDEPEDEPSDHAMPYSEHEEARNVSTRPKYVAPGVWAKPPPEKNISLDFVPTKLHAQVRGVRTVKRLPRREAIKSAKTDEEKRNAPRLREVVTNSKVNTVYTEEGYEDSAYDHAGHIRDADFHEGFARKLHDRRNNKLTSSNNEKKKEKHDKLAPDEFEEYEKDYQDDFKSGKVSDDENNLTGYGGNVWKGSEIDSKLVAENGIRDLEKDIEEDAEETERNSKSYQNAQESKHRDAVKAVNAKSEDDETDLKDEETEPDEIKEKSSKFQNRKNDDIINETKRSNLKQKMNKFYRENHETTTIPFDEASSTDTKILANSYDFLTNPSDSRARFIDQTTLRYVAPTATASFHRVDDRPTTIDYSQLFWNYFKTRQGPPTTELSALVSNSTTMNQRAEEQTPIATTTVQGPYLLMTKTDDIDLVNNVMSTVATFTSVQPLLPRSLPSLNLEDVEYSSPTNLLDSIRSSTPAVVTLNITEETYSQIADYHENPLLGSVLDNSKIAKSKVKYKIAMRPKSKKPVKSVHHRSSYRKNPSSSIFKKDKENKKIRDELNAKYDKVLNYIKSKQNVPEKKIVFSEDLTLMRPPTFQQGTYSIFSIDHPPVIQDHHSSVSNENEPSREANWRSLLQNQFYSQPIELPLRSDIQPFAYVQPVHLIYRKNQLPATKLIPPPLSLANTYANYHNDRQSDNYPSYIGGKPQQKRDNAFKYFPVVSEDSWRTRSRRKRSEFRNDDVKAAANNGVTNDDESEQRDKGTLDGIIDRSKGKSSNSSVIDTPIIDVPDTTLASSTRSRRDKNGELTILKENLERKPTTVNGENENGKDAQIIYNFKPDENNADSTQSGKEDARKSDTNVQKLTTKKRNFFEDETPLRENLKSTRNHDELLNESPKINSDVIDREIAARFNNNETSKIEKEEGKIETEIPSFDYTEELAEDSLAEPSTTTEAVIDTKKYPFYTNEDVPSASALKYVVDPDTIPRKTSRGMEFYNSRNSYKKCDEVEPNVDEALPEKEEPDPERGPQENQPRLRGLGDKLDCFKAKYFDENPLDSPLFAEKLIQEPTPPSELNPARFASRIMVLPKESEEYVVHQVSKKPERGGRQWRNRNRPYETHESIHVNYKHDRQTGRGRNAYLHTVRGSRPLNNGARRVKNRKSRPKASSTATQSPKFYQTASYQNQVYEDVMGNIRNLANAYQVYEITTLPPIVQNQATASSEKTIKIEKTMKIENVTSNSSSKENGTSLPDVPDDASDVASNVKSSEIKGLVPPPKYSAPRKTSYRKYRPLGKRRVALLRSSSLPRIIAHHRIKLNKRSATDDTARNSSESTINDKDEKTTTEESVKIDVGNDTIVKSIEEEMRKTNSTSETTPDLNVEESRQGQSLSTTLKIDDKKRRRNLTNNDETSEPSRKVIYTIRDRVRYSKPKWDAGGFGKFSTSSKTIDEDSRRKEPRYNSFKRKKKLNDDFRNNSTLNSTESTVGLENTTSSTENGDSNITEVYRAEESVVRRTIYGGKKYPERKENVEDESTENVEDEMENSTNVYQGEDHDFTTTTSSSKSKNVENLREYLESDPPGYAEAFPEKATTLSSKHRVNHEVENDEEKQSEETDYPESAANSWDDDFSEKIEEQVETPIKTKLSARDDDSEEISSKEEEASDKNQTFLTKRPSSAEKDDEHLERETFYRPFPFSRYRSMIKKKSETDESEEESEEKMEDDVFPWHIDKRNKDDRRKWLQNFDRYEYPWEKRKRLTSERRRKQKRGDRSRKIISENDEDEEESTRRERPVYAWERYDVPSKNVKTHRRDISRRYADASEESTQKIPFAKFSSRYSSSDGTKSPKNAREISRSITKFLEEDVNDEETVLKKKIQDFRPPAFERKSSSSPDGEISRETTGEFVPEDITQSPRRKNRRRKISQVDKNASNDFDSKKLKSEEIINEKEEEKPETEDRKLKKSNVDSSRMKIANQISNNPKEDSSATEQRKKHRQKISRNNSTISFGNASVEPTIKPVKKRRKSQSLRRPTSVSPSPKVDLDTSRSIFTPVRRRYFKEDETTKTNTSASSENSTTIQTDLEAETSTPKTRTIEQRSRVSKEKIITKTTYPKENFYPARKEPGDKLRIKSRRRKNIDKEKDDDENSSDDEKLIERKDEKRDADESKRSTVSEKPRIKNKDSFKNVGIKKNENISDFNTYDVINNEKNDNDTDSSQISEAYAISSLLQNIPPNRIKNVRADENKLSKINRGRKKQHSSQKSERKEKDTEGRRSSLLQTKFIKDPERRLYYYVERK